MVIRNSQTVSSPAEGQENTIQISVAITPEEKRRVYQFRYQTYVEEMSKHIKEIDHTNKLLYDKMDMWGITFAAKMGSELIGTARINIGPIEYFPKEVTEYLSLDTFLNCDPNNNPEFAFVTKIMVAPAYRHSPVFYLLIAKCYELSCLNHVDFIFGICNYHLIRLYEKMGLHRYYKNFDLPGFGLQSPIVLLTNDIAHLRKIRSPLFRLARKKEIADTKAGEWFRETFLKNSPLINSQTIDEDELWSILSSRLACTPTTAIKILQNLSEAEAKKVLHCCSSIVPCNSGNLITSQNDVSYSYNILLSGKLKSLNFHKPLREYSVPGQHFGTNGLTAHSKHTEDIAAEKYSEILVLSGIAFQRFFYSYPEIAHKVIQKVNSLTIQKQAK